MNRKQKIAFIVMTTTLCISLFFNFRYIFSCVDSNTSKSKVVFQNLNISDEINMPRYSENEKWAAVESQYINLYSYPTDVVFCGDSLIYKGYWNELYPDISVKNRGISGDTTEGLICRLNSIIKTQPQKVFIMIGTNDFARDFSMDDKQSNYETIINTIKSKLPSCEIYIHSLLPVSAENERDNNEIQKVNKMIETICTENDVTYINLYSSFVDEDGYIKDELTSDGLHLSLDGYELWYTLLTPYVY